MCHAHPGYSILDEKYILMLILMATVRYSSCEIHIDNHHCPGENKNHGQYPKLDLPTPNKHVFLCYIHAFDCNKDFLRMTLL